MKKILITGLIFLAGCALMRRADKAEHQVRKEITRQTYLDKIDVKNTGKETLTFTWWNDSAFYQYQSVMEQVADVKVVKLAAEENAKAVVKQTEKRVETIPVFGIAALLGLIIALYFLYKRFFK